MSAVKRPLIKHIVEQNVEEAAFLWNQRDAAVSDPVYDLSYLAFLDNRLDAQVEGLRVGGDFGWLLAQNELTEDDPGTVFAATALAFGSGNGEWMSAAVSAGFKSKIAFRGLVSAIGWLDDSHFEAVLPSLMRAKSIRFQRLGIAACGIRRRDPGTELEKAIQSTDLFLRYRGLRTAGDIKRRDLLPLVTQNLENKNHLCRFAAARSALLMGEKSALRTMGQFIQTKSEFRIPAMHIALRVLDSATAQKWLKALAQDKSQFRDVLTGFGIAGDPMIVPALIKQMGNPELARPAAEVFRMITGADFALEQLEGERPEGFESGPTDDPDDDNVEMDPDEDLAWPDAERVSEWWAAHQGEFSPGSRYLCGKPVSKQQCVHVLRQGTQPQRYAATLELALAVPDALAFNVRAPGFWQQAKLS